MKSKGRPGRIYHVMCATADVTYCIRLAGQTEQKERTEFRERRVKGREQTQMWADWMWHQLRHTSRDNSIQAFPLLLVLQATKSGCGGLGTMLPGNKASTESLQHAGSVKHKSGLHIICINMPTMCTGKYQLQCQHEQSVGSRDGQ